MGAKYTKERYTFGWTDPRSMSSDELKADWDHSQRQRQRQRWWKWVELGLMILIDLGFRYLL